MHKGSSRQSGIRPTLSSTASILLSSFLFLTLLFIAPEARAAGQCANTSYGDGVTCIQGTGAQARTGQTQVSVTLNTTQNHAVIATGYTCFTDTHNDCQNNGSTTLSIGDNKNPTEGCFKASPHSPFLLKTTDAKPQYLQEYIWVCPTIPTGVTTFTMTCSTKLACDWMTLNVTEWTGLTTSTAPFDVDGFSTPAAGTSASVSATTTKNHELMLTFGDMTADQWDCPVAPYQAPEECCGTVYGGNINTANTTGLNKGTQTATITWANEVQCLGGTNEVGSSSSSFWVMAGIKTPSSQ